MEMTTNSVLSVYEGWDGHQISLVHAVEPLTHEQLLWRPAPNLRSVGELTRHIALGRIDWCLRMSAPGIEAVAARVPVWDQDKHGNHYVVEDSVPIADRADELVQWLEETWKPIDAILHTWTVADLAVTYRHTWRGQTYALSRQWTTWRIMDHDIHHGGELALMLGMQGIPVFELGDLGGHINEPPLAE
jgi:uncharacterized damage-inducible protein DinB